jgi:large subunit ribosomal protein L21
MEAIFKDGPRQYRVVEGETVEVDYRDLSPGSAVEFANVLYLKQEGSPARFGQPLVAGARVLATVVGEVKGPKLVVQYIRRRKSSRRRVGHRQHFTQVRIEKIEG